MRKFVAFLSRNKLLNVIIIIAYYLGVVIPHEVIGQLIGKHIARPIGRSTYDFITISFGGILFAISCFFLYRNIRKLNGDKQKVLFAYLIISLIFILISVNVLMVINIEIIHFLQYAILSVLLYPCLRSVELTLITGTLLAILDELYQYVYLLPDNPYYDLNDVAFDVIGIGLGLIIIKSLDLGYESPNRKKGVYILTFLISFLAFSVLSYLFKIVSLYPNEEYAASLVREVNMDFWYHLPPGVDFHVFQPVEGIIIIMMLIAFYFGLALLPKTQVDLSS